MKYFVYFVILLLLFSCQKEDIKPSWDADILLPLAFTNLNIDNLLPDSLYQLNNDQTVSLVYQSKLPHFVLDTLIQLKDTSFYYSASLNNLSLSTLSYNYRVSMGSIALKDKELNGSSSPIYTAIITAHNTGQPTQLQSFGPYEYDNIQVNMGNYFKYIYINEATLEITINNQLPIALTSIAFTLQKSSTQEVLINDAFPIILPNSQQTRSVTLNNVALDSLLLAFFNVSSPGSMTPVVIDTNQSATAIISIKNLQIDSAVARFPAQELIKYNDVLRFSLPDSLQISELWIRSGIMKLEFFNTISQNIHLNFSLPAAKKNGQPLQLQITIPAAYGQTTAHVQTQIDLSQYRIKFRGIHEFEVIQGDLNNNHIIDPDTVNSLYYNLSASIDSTGQFVILTKNDSILVKCQFLHLTPDYIKGFFGYKEVNIDSNILISVFKNIEANGLHFDQAHFSLTIENQIGTIAKAYIQKLIAKNTQQNLSESLQGSVLSTPLTIEKPSDPANTQIDVTPTINTLHINHQNSNINDLISLLPNHLTYALKLKLNDLVPLPSPALATDFLYYGDGISVSLNAEVPLSLSANKLQLIDTVKVDLNKVDVKNIQNGSIVVHSKNYFPIEADVSIYALDSNKVMYDSLHSIPIKITAGTINMQTNKVDKPSVAKNNLPFTPDKLKRILNARYFLIKANFSTLPANQHVRIYSDYSLNIKLIGDFNYVFSIKEP